MRLMWTDEEVDILKKHYPTADTETLLELLPRFTIEKIRTKASRLGIKRQRVDRRRTGIKMTRWTKEESERLKKVYSHSTNEELLEMFPRFTLRQIRNKARSLNLKKLDDIKQKDKEAHLAKMIGDREWTEEEENLLEEKYYILGAKGMTRYLPHRTQKAIAAKARKMGLTTEQGAVWKMTDVSISKDDVFSIDVSFERVNL